LALAAENTLPKDSLIVSLETSAQMPPVRFGHGVIIRVGDRSSIFDSDASRFLWETAQILSAETPSFKCQRALMSGGTCEATAYQAFGYQTAGVCVALGNYHNCGGNFNIAPEHVSADDVVCMVGLLTEAARKMGDYSKITSQLPRRLNKLLKEARTQLARPYPARNPIL
jgi:endoglucanase